MGGAADAPRFGGIMGSFSIWHWLVVLMVVLLLFGGGKVSNLMGEFAKGIKSFKKNMAEDDDVPMATTAERPAPTIAPPQTPPTSPQPTTTTRPVESVHQS
jgi:sec-independent protein translocase protein TatA